MPGLIIHMKIELTLLFGFFNCCLHGQQIKITAGDIPISRPVEIQLLKPINSKKSYVLVEGNTGTRIAAQLAGRQTLVYIPPTPIAAGSSVTYQLQPTKKKNKHEAIKVEKTRQGILIKIRKKPLLFYHVKEAFPPADTPAYYKRSGFIHPLYSPNGQVLTDDFPVAHVHQHAIFSAWTSTRFRNKSIDFWNQHNKTGTVEHSRIISLTQGPVFTELITELTYRSLMDGPILSEQWKLRIYPFSEYYLFDLETLQRNITTDTLFLNSYHYGGMAFRGSREWNPDDKKYFTNRWNIVTSHGFKDAAANHTHAGWVDAWGKVGDKTAGAAVLNHAANFRYPQAIRVHPTMPYWSYAPVIDGSFIIAPGGEYKSKFRYYIHNKAADTAFVNQLHREWIAPPGIVIF